MSVSKKMENYNKICLLLTLTVQLVVGQQRCLQPYNYRPGECRPIHQCPYIERVQEDSRYSGYISQSRNACGWPNYLVCCPFNVPVPTTTPPPPPPPRPEEARILPTPGECGTHPLEERIQGGEPSGIYKHPWMARIIYTKPGNRVGYHCGGALINPYWVITAAHCLVHKDKIYQNWKVSGVRLGEWKTTSDPDCDESTPRKCAPPVQDISVVERIVHKDYVRDSKQQQNDIALLRLDRPATYTNFIQPICLPVSRKVVGKNYDGDYVRAVGWGKTENGVGSELKMEAELDVMSMDKCNDVYSQINVTLIDKQLCAGGAHGIDSCQGDSGGPLTKTVTTDDNRLRYHYIVGIISFGRNPCGQRGWPGVYTRMDKYIDWVRSTIGSN